MARRRNPTQAAIEQAAAAARASLLADAPSDGSEYVRKNGAWVTSTASGTGGTDHGALTGLSDDDHSHYLNNSRGDARYSQLGHAHSYETAGAVATHEAAANPHPTYLTQAEGDAAYAAAGHSHGGSGLTQPQVMARAMGC